MANLSLFIFIFGCIFINEKVEAFDTIIKTVSSVLNTLQQLYGPIINTAQLPVKYPLPPLGTTSCSTYPHADKGVVNFQGFCYTQSYLEPNYSNSSYKCRKHSFTVGLPLVNVPFPIPAVVGFTPQAGYYYSDYVSKTNSSQHLSLNLTFVEAQTAEMLCIYTDAANLTLIVTAVITKYTDKGYVTLLCPMTKLSKPICSSPVAIYACTYQRNPPADDVQALTQGLDQYPYYFGKNLQPMDQTGCP